MSGVTTYPRPPPKVSAIVDEPVRRRKTYLGCLGWQAAFALLFLIVAAAGASVYLFAFGGLEQVQDLFAPPTQTGAPTASPVPATPAPTDNPTTQAPTTQAPTLAPTTQAPTSDPTTAAPTLDPTTQAPTPPTTAEPTSDPTQEPTNQPTDSTAAPTNQPTADPTNPPTTNPTNEPTTAEPTADPTNPPTSNPTHQPTSDPTNPPTNAPTREPTVPTPPTTASPTPLPTLLRSPTSPYIEVVFTNAPSTPSAAVTAFSNAAARWSTILRGMDLFSATIPITDTFNLYGCSLSNDASIPATLIDHLFIAADIAPIDGAGGILGSAGPCNAFLESVDRPFTFLPVFGAMNFDSADLLTLELSGELEDVILHEMAHVLGIGTLWGGDVFLGLPELIQDPIFQSGGTFPFNDPQFVGHGAKSEYAVLSGTTDNIPVEDGSFAGLTPTDLLNGFGQGSVDGHWRETLFETELMTPAIGGSSNPMSLMTLRSLEDIGYAVDTSQADAYSIPSPNSGGDEATSSSAKIYLQGDIFRCPTLKEGLKKAYNRARARTRLGGRHQSLHDG